MLTFPKIQGDGMPGFPPSHRIGPGHELLAMLSAQATASGAGIADGSGRGPLEVQSHHLPGGTRENLGNPQSGYPVSRPKFEPSTTRTQVYVTARLCYT
jgi:hypothetical protein